MKTLEEYNNMRPAQIPADWQVLSIFEEAKKECKTKLQEYEASIEIDVENSRYRIVHSEIGSGWRDASHILGNAEENREAINKPIEAFQEFIDALKGDKGDSEP